MSESCLGALRIRITFPIYKNSTKFSFQNNAVIMIKRYSERNEEEKEERTNAGDDPM
jgi:hypothetical protein